MELIKGVFKLYFTVKSVLESENGYISVAKNRQCHYWLHAKGVTFNGSQENIRFTSRMTRLRLEKRAVEQDSNAVVVLNEANQVMGWIGRTLSGRMTILMDKDKVRVSNWRKIGGGNGYPTGLLVEIEELVPCSRLN